MSTIVITGASSGIGAIAARRLAEQGHEIAVVGRNPQRTRAVAADTGGRPFIADYDSLASVRDLASALLDAYASIEVLLNNAGGLVSPRGLTADGNEKTFQHNHLAPFLLTNLLLERLEASGGRVISTSSVMNRIGRVRLDDLQWEKRRWHGGWKAYGTSKLETILFIRELARRTSLEAYSVHPGYVATQFGTDSPLIRISALLRSGGFGVPAEEGAAPLIRLASDQNVPGDNGGYFDRMTASGASPAQARDAHLAAELWEASARLVSLS